MAKRHFEVLKVTSPLSLTTILFLLLAITVSVTVDPAVVADRQRPDIIWHRADLTSKNIQCLAIAPTNAKTIYTGAGEGGVFKSADRGGSWKKASKGLPALSPTLPYAIVISFAIDPISPQTIYAGTSGGGVCGVYKSTDGGGSWMGLKTGIPDYDEVYTLAIDPANTRTIYAGKGEGGVFKSTDGGHSWSRLSPGIPFEVHTLAIAPAKTTKPKAIYAGTDGHGVFRSTNDGDSWAPVNEGLTDRRVRTLAIDQNSGTIYAGTNGGGVFKLAPRGGMSWKAVNRGLPPHSLVCALAIGPAQAIYAGTDHGVYQSTNGGSWVNTGLKKTVYCLVSAPGEGRIYAGTASHGLFVGNLPKTAVIP